MEGRIRGERAPEAITAHVQQQHQGRRLGAFHLVGPDRWHQTLSSPVAGETRQGGVAELDKVWRGRAPPGVGAARARQGCFSSWDGSTPEIKKFYSQH